MPQTNETQQNEQFEEIKVKQKLSHKKPPQTRSSNKILLLI